MRLHPAGEPFEDGSWPAELRGSGTDRRRSRGVRRIRVVEYRLAEHPGESYRLATTLLDPGRFPARDLAGLYHERWEIETAYDEVKTHLLGPGASLRSKTPELVLQEVDGLMLAHCAVRSLIHRAAEKAREDPDGLSFTHAVRVVRRRLQNPGAVSPDSDALAEAVDAEILEERAVRSRGQAKPRGVRRKMSSYRVRRRGPISRRTHQWSPEIIR